MMNHDDTLIYPRKVGSGIAWNGRCLSRRFFVVVKVGDNLSTKTCVLSGPLDSGLVSPTQGWTGSLMTLYCVYVG